MKITHCSRLGRGLLKRKRRVALENKASSDDIAWDVCAVTLSCYAATDFDWFHTRTDLQTLALVCHLTRSGISFPDIRLRSHAIGYRGALSSHRNVIYKTNQMPASARPELAFFCAGKYQNARDSARLVTCLTRSNDINDKKTVCVLYFCVYIFAPGKSATNFKT